MGFVRITGILTYSLLQGGDTLQHLKGGCHVRARDSTAKRVRARDSTTVALGLELVALSGLQTWARCPWAGKQASRNQSGSKLPHSKVAVM